MQTIAKLEQELADAERRLAKSQAEVAAYASRVARLKADLLKYRLAEGFPLGPPNKKNQGIYLTWQDVKVALDSDLRGEGLTNEQLFSIALSDRPHLIPETFRSHMHHLKKAGLVEKRMGRWTLVQLEK